jgi:hypothetical protein
MVGKKPHLFATSELKLFPLGFKNAVAIPAKSIIKSFYYLWLLKKITFIINYGHFNSENTQKHVRKEKII